MKLVSLIAGEKCVKFVAHRLHTQTRDVVPSVHELLRCDRESSLEEIMWYGAVYIWRHNVINRLRADRPIKYVKSLSVGSGKLSVLPGTMQCCQLVIAGKRLCELFCTSSVAHAGIIWQCVTPLNSTERKTVKDYHKINMKSQWPISPQLEEFVWCLEIQGIPLSCTWARQLL